VVTEDEFRADLLRREQELRRIFEELYQGQKRILQRVRILRAGSAHTASEYQGMAAKLLVMEKDQRQAIRGITALAGSFTRILAEVQYNRLEQKDGRMQRRLTNGIIEPLRGLEQQDMLRAAGGFAALRAKLAGASAEVSGLAQAEATQREIIARMAEILNQMVRSESFYEAVKALRNILKQQHELIKDTDHQSEKLTEGLFDDQ